MWIKEYFSTELNAIMLFSVCLNDHRNMFDWPVVWRNAFNKTIFQSKNLFCATFFSVVVLLQWITNRSSFFHWMSVHYSHRMMTFHSKNNMKTAQTHKEILWSLICFAICTCSWWWNSFVWTFNCWKTNKQKMRRKR